MQQSQIHRVSNLEAFAGVLALDKWLCNTDARQSVFWRRDREQTYSALFIDHGYCFNNAEWNFPDAPLHGAYRWNEVYAGVKGWESFEPWLSQIEQMDEAKILASRDDMPPEWYGADGDALSQLLSRIVKRRSRVRELIQDFRDSSRKPFPGWAVRHYLTSVIL